jgi:hypothetical protein
MMLRIFVFILLAFVWGGGGVPSAHAHHGPPHEEVDEFDTPATRLVVPFPTTRVSWPAVLISVAAVAAVYLASRRYGIDTAPPAPSPVRVRR